MSDHTEASKGSQRLCQLLHDQLAARIPRLERAELKQWCALYQRGGNRFAYISHRKRTSDLQIWCAGDVPDLLGIARLQVTPRDEIRTGWEAKFPARFFVRSEADVDAAAELLYKVSWRAA